MDARTLEARARAEGTPLLDEEGATFVWRGRGPVTLVGDYDDWRGRPLSLRRVGPGLWMRRLPLPPDAYVEYLLEDANGRRVRDPLNPHASDNGFGGLNSCFSMPGRAPSPLLRRQRGVPRGTLTRHALETHEFAVGRTREVHLYAPPTGERCPLLVVLDGGDYLRRVHLPVMLDNLLAARRIRPLALALVANGGEARTVEYSCSDATLGLLRERVLPLAHAHLRLVDERRSPGAHGLLGASLGGLMALYGALRAPDVFGRVLSQSGAFAIPGHEFVVFPLAEKPPPRPLQAYLDCGHREVLVEGNRRMAPLLERAGHRVTYREHHAGHNYPSWGDEVARGLEWLFPRKGAR